MAVTQIKAPAIVGIVDSRAPGIRITEKVRRIGLLFGFVRVPSIDSGCITEGVIPTNQILIGLSTGRDRSEKIVSKSAGSWSRPKLAGCDLCRYRVNAFKGISKLIAGNRIPDVSRRRSNRASLRVDLALGDLPRGERIIDCTLIDVST